jgi:ABC-type antimicrobial peptide transport system permease subunit
MSTPTEIIFVARQTSTGYSDLSPVFLRQFLIEAVVLCLAGGILGIILGCGGSYLITRFLRWPTETSVPAIVASVIVSASVGIIFGYYPAWKASRLDPIEALRYE